VPLNVELLTIGRYIVLSNLVSRAVHVSDMPRQEVASEQMSP
jgi:hypothetical protein